MNEVYYYKREVNRSVLHDGFGVERANLNVFLNGQEPLKRGEKRKITLMINGRAYPVILKNLNNPVEKRKNDAYQIRYTAEGEVAKVLQGIFHKTYAYLQGIDKIKAKGDRSFSKIPDEYKEYIVIYTTSDPTVFTCEAIVSDEMAVLKDLANEKSERLFEATFNYDVKDDYAGINKVNTIRTVRKLNRKIGDMLKEHYGYRCQICGRYIGEKYDSKLVEAHHIDYFVKSLNNDMKNIMIVCPNHHGIIHDRNPKYNAKDCTYTYPNGLVESLMLNDHL